MISLKSRILIDWFVLCIKSAHANLYFSSFVQRSTYTLNPQKTTWGFICYPSLNFSLPFCFSAIFRQQSHHQMTPLHLIPVLMTKVFLCSNSKHPSPSRALLQGIASISRQSRGKRVQTAACGMGSLVK